MLQLNYPAYNFRFKNKENKVHIFDPIRKKFVVLQPEEWVRQHLIQHLNISKEYPLSLINVEKMVNINGLKRRYDVAVYNPNGSIEVLCECKAPEIKINQITFDQIAQYNMKLKAKYLLVTNGLKHFYCKMDFEQEKYTFLPDIPDFNR